MSEIGPKSRPPLATELYAAGRIIGNKCFEENFEFLACKNKDEKPSACLAQGEAVHKCVYDLYQEIAKKAQKEFAAHAKCLDGSDLRTQECKKTQRAFETAYYSQS